MGGGGSQHVDKNKPAYGRQSISRLMRIVAPQYGGPRIPKNLNFLKNGKIIQTAKLKNVWKYAKICNIPFDQRSLIHQGSSFPGGPRIPKNLNFLKNGKNHAKNKKNSKTSRNMGELAIRPLTRCL